jgi:hypothetical protein
MNNFKGLRLDLKYDLTGSLIARIPLKDASRSFPSLVSSGKLTSPTVPA